MDTILFALVMVALTVILHILGTTLAAAFAARMLGKQLSQISWLRMEVLMTGVVSFLLVTHFLEASIWAVLYWEWQILPTFSTAFYFSLTSYTTVGYGDVVLPIDYRILGPVEGLIGVLMMGWSTAIIVAIVSRYYHGSSELESNQGAHSSESSAQ